MPRLATTLLVVLGILASAGCPSRAGGPGWLDDAALRAYAARSFDKAAMMNRTMQLGRNHGVPVVAEFPCSDVCPNYTVRIIHYDLPPGVGCAVAGGMEKSVLVPVSITAVPRTFCVPKVLAGGGYDTR